MPTNPKFIAKIESEEPTLKLAVLIDADNAQASKIESLLKEIATIGEATVKRIYGDFTVSNSNPWKKTLQKYAIKPIQQFAYTTGKNATDSTLIIDAMDLLYTRRFDGFCLISSDSDFTGLALRIREEGLLVFGFGEQKTPEAFRNACHKFIFTEVFDLTAPNAELPPPSLSVGTLTPGAAQPDSTVGRKAPAQQTPPTGHTETSIPAPIRMSDYDIHTFMLDALTAMPGDDGGWINLGTVNSYLTKLKPDFDPRLYGYKKLRDFLRAMPTTIEMEERVTDGTSAKAVYVRRRG